MHLYNASSRLHMHILDYEQLHSKITLCTQAIRAAQEPRKGQTLNSLLLSKQVNSTSLRLTC